MAFLRQYKDLMVPFEDINSATNNFGASNLIGRGGFGLVYKGEMSCFKGQCLVAFKRLDNTSEQGETEFSKEITTLSHYNHENLISLLGFCSEGREKILVYEYASNGSLDHHLSSPTLTWRQRLKICLQAAKALEYLHDPKGSNQRVIHFDIKSANIMLDGEWNAKLSDLGLSKMGPANQAQTFLISIAVGTLGYCDPQYVEMGFLTKESDVYSFGVLLSEVLCGKLCYEIINDQTRILVANWKQIYEQKRLEEFVFQELMEQGMDHHALVVFSDIAYKCLKRSHEELPTMTEVVTELEIAFESQEISEGKEELFDYEEMARTTEPPLNYRCKAEIKILLSKGVFLNGGKMWFSINKNGHHTEMISIAACLLQNESDPDKWTSSRNSKFAVGRFKTWDGHFEADVRPRFLSPFITYAVNLVFQFDSGRRDRSIKNTRLKYKLKGETKHSTAYVPVEREDGRWMLELYQFDTTIHDQSSMFNFEILFNLWEHEYQVMEVEGIEFQPLEMRNCIPDSSSDAIRWEEKLPADYEDIIKWSKDSVPQWTTKKELYSILCHGFLVNDGQEWFSLNKHGKRCRMLSARVACKKGIYSRWLPFPETRFGEALRLTYDDLEIDCKIESQVLSSTTTYASYLVYKLVVSGRIGYPVKVTDKILVSDGWKVAPFSYIYLSASQTPVIRPKADENTHKPFSKPKLKGLPQQRSDGWLEVQIWEFQTDTTTDAIPMNLIITAFHYLDGLVVKGIEFRPI